MRVGRFVAGAAAVAAVAGIALSGSSAEASPDSVFAQLALNGLQTAQAPNGTHALYISPGESVTFALGSPPPGLQGALGLSYVLLNAAAVPGGSSPVTIDKKTTVTYVFDSAGSFALNWTAYNNLKQRIPPTGGEYTSAAIVVTGGVPPSGSSSAPPSSSTASSSTANPGGHPSFPAPSDHGLAASASALVHSSHATSSSASSSAATSSDVVTPSPSTSTTVVAGIAKSSSPSRPVGLAVIAIVAFAVVAGWYAYQYFGIGALRRG